MFAGGLANRGKIDPGFDVGRIALQGLTDIDECLFPVTEKKIGPPLEEDSRLCAMISPDEVNRVEAWIGEAVNEGARLVSGGERDGATLAPTILAEVKPEMRVFRDEIFGPAVTTTSVGSAGEAIALANRSDYGLAAGIFTRDVTNAMNFARFAEAGSLHINWTPLWRADFMPYGGLKGSGIGKEGPRYAVEEMTDAKTIIVHGLE